MSSLRILGQREMRPDQRPYCGR